MNTNIPDDLMDNVERKLRKHVKNKRKNIYKAAAVVIGCGIILPTSVFAYANYTDGISYKQEIDLARQHNNITKINKVFKYKNVSVNIKEILADDTGIEVIYDISDPRYFINSVKFGDKDGKAFKTWGVTTPANVHDKGQEKSFNIIADKDAIEYIKNNPVTVKIDNLVFDDTIKSKKLIDEASSFINRTNSNLKVDWLLKMQVPMQKTKITNINKEYALDIGTLKINSLKIGVLKSVIDYSFVPKDKNILIATPMFSIRLDNKYINANGGTNEFESVYYKNLSQIGIKLIAMNVTYNSNDSKVYKVDKNNLPMEINYNGEKIKITSIEEKKDSTDYNVEYEKNNRIYNSVEFDFSKQLPNGDFQYGSIKGKIKRGKVQFVDKTSRDKIYASLVKKVPNLIDIEKNISIDGESNALEDADTSYKMTVAHKGISSPAQFKILNASKNLIYDEDEVIVKTR